MIPHPNFGDLNRYADRELSEQRRARVAKHLAKCSVCRSTVIALRGITTEAPRILAPKPPADALDKILMRQASGETVILPVADPPRRRIPFGLLRSAAAAVAVALASVVAVFIVQELGAEFSELNLSRVSPHLDNTLHVEYRSTSMFVDEDRLVIRARYRVPGDALTTGPAGQVITAPLYRYDGHTFKGIIEFPADAVYTVFAIEDPAGERVDSRGGALWQRVKGETHGTPSYQGLVQKQQDLSGSSWQLALETALQAAELYPEEPEAWARVSFLQQLGAAGTNRDALRERHAARFAGFERAYQGVPLSQARVAGMYSYASRAVSESERLEYWKERLYSEAPSHPTAVQTRVGDIQIAHEGNPRVAMEELEKLWQEVGSVHPHLPRTGFRMALLVGAADEISTWAERRETMEPRSLLEIAEALVEIGTLRNEGMAKLRQELARLDATSPRDRALQRSVREDRIRLNVRRRRALTTLGTALLEAGHTSAGLDTLRLAVAEGWNVAAFRAMANARLSLGDTAGAVTMLARVAVDPNTSTASIDSLVVAGAVVLDGTDWEMLVQRARTEMYRRTLSESVTRTVQRDVDLVGPNGRHQRLRDLTEGRVTVVVFWARFCGGACEGELLRLERIADRIGVGKDDEVAAFVITSEPLSVAVQQLVEQQGISLSLFHDINRAAHVAFSSWEIPGYYLVDRSGRVRFSGGSLDQVVRQAEALRSTGR